MSRGARRVMRSLVCAATLPLTACGLLQGAQNLAKSAVFPTVEVLRVTTRSDAITNPDDNGDALPVTVRIYQLQEVNPLLQTDYEKLMDNDKEALGSSLIQRFELVAYPRSTVVQEFPIKPGTRYVALLPVMRKTPVPAYYLLDSTTIGSSGITLQIGSQNMLMTAGPKPYNTGNEGGDSRPRPPDVKLPSAPAMPSIPKAGGLPKLAS